MLLVSPTSLKKKTKKTATTTTKKNLQGRVHKILCSKRIIQKKLSHATWTVLTHALQKT